MDFWVVWREPGFLGLPPPDGNWQGTMQYVHVTRFKGFEKTNDNLLLIRTDGSILEFDFLVLEDERERWDEFRAQKAEYADLYAEYYASCAEEIAAAANSL